MAFLDGASRQPRGCSQSVNPWSENLTDIATEILTICQCHLSNVHKTNAWRLEMRQVAIGMVGLLLLGGVAAVRAEAPVCCASDDHGIRSHSVATDLGKVSPATENYSKLPDWQAFVFSRNGVRYVELADASGLPKAAFTLVDGSVLALPVGADVLQQVAFAPALTTVVFEDASVAVGVVTNADGSVSWQVYVK